MFAQLKTAGIGLLATSAFLTERGGANGNATIGQCHRHGRDESAARQRFSKKSSSRFRG